MENRHVLHSAPLLYKAQRHYEHQSLPNRGHSPLSRHVLASQALPVWEHRPTFHAAGSYDDVTAYWKPALPSGRGIINSQVKRPEHSPSWLPVNTTMEPSDIMSLETHTILQELVRDTVHTGRLQMILHWITVLLPVRGRAQMWGPSVMQAHVLQIQDGLQQCVLRTQNWAFIKRW